MYRRKQMSDRAKNIAKNRRAYNRNKKKALKNSSQETLGEENDTEQV